METAAGQNGAQYVLLRALFVRLVGLVYAIAFLSLWLQVDGLIGSRGILPAAEYLAKVQAHWGNEAYWRLPTLCWLGADDAILHVLCGTGAMAALGALVGFAPAIMLLLAWLCYLSLVGAGQAFFSFQWDILLLETGFLAIFFAPLQWRPCKVWAAPPSLMVLWLLRWLLFRLMFSSGLVKLLSQDPSWSEFAALNFHYQTQPLPAWTSWYAQQLPEWMQMASVGVMFCIELVVPFVIFAPRRVRLWGCAALVFLQVLIGLSGNYGFFNLLSLVLCLLLLDDRALQRLPILGRLLALGLGRTWPRWSIAPIAIVVLLLSSMRMGYTTRLSVDWPAPMQQFHAFMQPFYLANNYGLFAVMTTQRPEIIVEGSADGQVWRAYEFKWKPGELSQAPAFMQPHMPRLDWQMWFAALRNYKSYPWYSQLMLRLLQGEPKVLDLLGENPFPQGPPRYVRARLYQYYFTTWQERNATGNWWRRQEQGLYCPVLSLRKEG